MFCHPHNFVAWALKWLIFHHAPSWPQFETVQIHLFHDTLVPVESNFFSPDHFDRRLLCSLTRTFFTGQSPGIWHDAHHVYAGGPRMCMGEGQLQAVLLRRGQAVGWRKRGSVLLRGSRWCKGCCPQCCGLTNWRKNLRQCRSTFRSSALYNLRWPPPKWTTEVAT